MSTLADQATARRQQQTPADIAMGANDHVTVISYVEPDERAWLSARSREPARPVSAQPRKEVSVTLRRPFTDLPPEADRTVTLSDDRDEMLDHLMFVMAAGGWPAVQETFTQLREVEKGLGPVTDVCLRQAQVMVNRLSLQLGQVEEIARRLLLQYLELGLQQADAATQTFLTGWPNLTAADLAQHSYIQDKVTLNPGKHVDELRELLKCLPELNKHVNEAARNYNLVSHYRQYLQNPDVALEPTSMRYHAAQLNKANRILAVSGRWPVVAWLTDLAEDVSEVGIKSKVVEQITLAVKAIAAVRREAHRGNRWPVAGGIGYDPSIERAERLIAPNSREKPPRLPLLKPWDDLAPNPFTVNMRSPRGPWRYPQMITLALEQMGHSQNSPLAAAGRAAMGGEEAAGLGIVLGLGAGAVGIASGPIGMGLSVAMALWNLWYEWDKYAADSDGYRAMLDPAWSIHTEASLRGVVAGVLGVLAEVVPGKKALAFVGAESVVRVTGQ